MVGTKAGCKKTVERCKELYGANFYSEIGRKGGRSGKTGGFAADPERAVLAGKVGGKISRRGPAKK